MNDPGAEMFVVGVLPDLPPPQQKEGIHLDQNAGSILNSERKASHPQLAQTSELALWLHSGLTGSVVDPDFLDPSVLADTEPDPASFFFTSAQWLRSHQKWQKFIFTK